MAHEPIPVELVEIALARAEGGDFEQFAQSFLSGLEGIDFVPLGGTADGGADGFRRLELCTTSRPGIFYQFTVQENHRSKIRTTVERLIEVGRKPKQLVYVTSRIIPKLDIEEDELSEELGIRVRIRDGKYIEHNINDGPKTQAAFKNHLAHYTEFLKRVGAASILSHSKVATDPSGWR